MSFLFGAKSVFVSYASEQKATAEGIALSLRGHGFKVFLDKDDLPAGASYDDRIHRAIDSSAAFVFLVSPEALTEGRYTLTELKFAREKWPNPSQAVLPVMAVPTDMAKIPAYVKAVTILEPQGNLAAEVSGAIARRNRKRNYALMAGAAVLALLVAGASYVLLERFKESIDLSVSLHADAPRPPGAAEGAQAFAVTYQEDAADGKAPHIAYRVPYLDLIRKGGPVKGHTYRGSPFQWSFPPLSVKLVNNTGRNILLSHAMVSIAASEVAREPVLIFEDRAMNTLLIANEGWGEVIDPVLTFSVKDPDSDVELFAPKTHTVERKTFAIRDSVRIGPFVPAHLRNREAVLVAGTIAYGPASDRKTLAFETTVALQILAGQGLPPTFAYPPAFFEAGKAPATLSIPISQTIKPGDADHFLVTLATDKTSRNKLSLSFRTTTGQVIPAGDVLLDLFVPRTKGGSAKAAGSQR